MGVFEKCQIVFDLDAIKVSYKVRQGLKTKIAHHGGAVAYSLNKKTTHMIVDEGKKGGFSHKCSKARKLNIPIISISYVDDCVAASRLLNPTPYLIVDTQAQSGFGHGKIVGFRQKKDKDSVLKRKVYHLDLHTVKVYPWNSPNAPPFPAEGDYQVARTLLLDSIKDKKTGKRLFYHLELHAVKKQIRERSDEEPDKAFMYRVFSHYGVVADLKDEESGARECRYLKTSRAAVDVYRQLYEQRIKPPWRMKRCKKIISRWIGSPTFRKDLFEVSSIAGGHLASDVVSLVEQIWLETVGHLNDILACPMARVTRQQVEKAETLLLQIREGLDRKAGQAELSRLSKEYYSHIPHKKQLGLKNKQDITAEQGICQLISDIQSVSEATDWSVRGSTEAKYRTLRCHIEQLCSDSAEHQEVLQQIQDGRTGNQALKVKRIFAVGRFVENSNFAHHLGNKKLLFHSSKPSNFLGILSRGLLMPKIVVEDLGGERTDAGMLGHGIYFADSASTSARYSAQSTLSQTRFMMICEVSLGRCHEVNRYEPHLNQPPSGYDSVKGVGAVAGQVTSDFSANEYTIYNVNQQRLRYLVEFAMPEDRCDTPSSLLTPVPMETEDADTVPSKWEPAPVPVEMKDVMAVPNPNDKVVPGLQTSGNKPIPLTNVCVRAKMMDLAAQVVIFQEYDNQNSQSIEAKYVFPLEDSAAVCGFEAFIGDKHIVGTVKEKAQAHKEYKEAISKGHGAYLMDEEAPDVFTVSVGNLPPKVKVVIKITYVIELSVEGDKIAFNLPGSVASWRKEAAMSQELQKDVATMKIKDQSSIIFSLNMSLAMATDITSIQSITHPLKIKQTATKAVITLPEDCTTLGEGFQLLVGVADIHRPRMWVEQHPENKDSQACMVTFYPDFELSNVEKPEIILLLDCSNSMKEGPLQQAKQILVLALHHMTDDCIFNVVTFGTGFEELFPSSQAKSDATMEAAKLFISAACATQGNTDVWRPLESYFLLRSEGLQNLFLVSDGHINNEDSTLHAIAQNIHSRIFTFGISSSANRHLLKGMARVGRGAFEFFDSNAKSRWESKVKAQLNKAKQPSVSSLAVEWKQHDNDPPTPVQAPRQLTSLFSGSRLVVYGFVQYCTEACLKASIDGEEVSTMVSTPQLCITNGQMLHRLTARAVIRDWEDGTLDPDKTHHEARKNEQKSYIIDLSKKYSIVTQLTSFVAIEKREKGEDLKRDGVSLKKLAEKEDVDILSYMDWQKTVRLDTEEELDPMKKVEGLLEQANLESTFSILKAEEYYRQALDLAKTHLPASTETYLKIASMLNKFLVGTKGDTPMAEKLCREVQSASIDKRKAVADDNLREVLRGLYPKGGIPRRNSFCKMSASPSPRLDNETYDFESSLRAPPPPRDADTLYNMRRRVGRAGPALGKVFANGALPPQLIPSMTFAAAPQGRGYAGGAPLPPPPSLGILFAGAPQRQASGAPPPRPPSLGMPFAAAPPPPPLGYAGGAPPPPPPPGGAPPPPPTQTLLDRSCAKPPLGYASGAPPPPPPSSGMPFAAAPRRGYASGATPPPPPSLGMTFAAAPQRQGYASGAPPPPPPSTGMPFAASPRRQGYASGAPPPPPPSSGMPFAAAPRRGYASGAPPTPPPSLGMPFAAAPPPPPLGYAVGAPPPPPIPGGAPPPPPTTQTLLDRSCAKPQPGYNGAPPSPKSDLLQPIKSGRKGLLGSSYSTKSLSYSPTSPSYSPTSPSYSSTSLALDSRSQQQQQQQQQSTWKKDQNMQVSKTKNILPYSTRLGASEKVKLNGYGINVDDDHVEAGSNEDRRGGGGGGVGAGVGGGGGCCGDGDDDEELTRNSEDTDKDKDFSRVGSTSKKDETSSPDDQDWQRMRNVCCLMNFERGEVQHLSPKEFIENQLRGENFKQIVPGSHAQEIRTPFGQSSPGKQQPGTLFGQSQTGQQSSTFFGQSQTTQAPTCSTLFGKSQTTQAPSTLLGKSQTGQQPSTLFGYSQTAQAPSTLFGQSKTGQQPSTLFGQSQTGQQSSTLFGRSQTGQQPSTLFGQSKTGQQPSTLFGRSQTGQQPSTLFGQSKTGQQSSTLFGQSQAGQQSSTLIGQSQTGQQSSTLFGQSQTGQQSRTWFGQSQAGQQSSTLFGQSKTGQQPSTLFGQSQTGQQSSTLFGQSQTGQQPGTLFGQSQTGQQSRTLFGQSQTGQQPSTLFGQSQTGQQPSTLFGQSQTGQQPSSLLGQSQTGQQPSTLFGQSQTGQQPSTLFGQSKTGQQSSTLFGQSKTEQQSSTLFGQSQTGQQPSTLFGQSQTGQQPSTLFGQSQTGQQPSTLFGQSQAGQQSSTLFGQSQTAQAPSTLFGQSQTGQQPSTLFGQSQTAQAPSTLFGQSQTTQGPSTLFGQPSMAQQSGRFFAQSQTGQQLSTLFGQSQTAQAPSTLFGQFQTGQQPSTLFGQSQTEEQPGTLFVQSQTAQAPSTLFGQSQTGQQPSTLLGQSQTGQQPSTLFGQSQTGQQLSTLFGQSQTTQGPSTLFGQPQMTQQSGRFFAQSQIGQQPSTFFGSSSGTNVRTTSFGRPSGDTVQTSSVVPSRAPGFGFGGQFGANVQTRSDIPGASQGLSGGLFGKVSHSQGLFGTAPGKESQGFCFGSPSDSNGQSSDISGSAKGFSGGLFGKVSQSQGLYGTATGKESRGFTFGSPSDSNNHTSSDIPEAGQENRFGVDVTSACATDECLSYEEERFYRSNQDKSTLHSDGRPVAEDSSEETLMKYFLNPSRNQAQPMAQRSAPDPVNDVDEGMMKDQEVIMEEVAHACYEELDLHVGEKAPDRSSLPKKPKKKRMPVERKAERWKKVEVESSSSHRSELMNVQLKGAPNLESVSNESFGMARMPTTRSRPVASIFQDEVADAISCPVDMTSTGGEENERVAPGKKKKSILTEFDTGDEDEQVDSYGLLEEDESVYQCLDLMHAEPLKKSSSKGRLIRGARLPLSGSVHHADDGLATKKDPSMQARSEEKEEDAIDRTVLSTQEELLYDAMTEEIDEIAKLLLAVDSDDEDDECEEEGQSRGKRQTKRLSSYSSDDDFGIELEMSMSHSMRESWSRSRSPPRSRKRKQLAYDVTVEELTSRVYRQKRELRMWQQALFKGYIPDSFPGWNSRELYVLKQAVNAFMVTLEPFHVPVIVESLPDKTTLESLVGLDLLSCEDEDFFSMTSNDEEDTSSDGDDSSSDGDDSSSDEECEAESRVFFTLGKYVNFVKLFGLLKNAGIYSLGAKTASKLLRVLLAALVVSASKRCSLTTSTQHLDLNQFSQYIRQLEMARTDSWLEVASQMIA